MAVMVAAGVGLAVLIVTRGSDESPRTERRPGIGREIVGRGARAALVLRRSDAPPQRAVVFLHGWRLLGREAYRAWLLHLARRGVTVIAPRYQAPSGTAPETTLDNALAGVRAALTRVRVRPGGVVVVGHSAGAALAADYAAIAAEEALPAARAVLAIYPGRVIRATLEPIPQIDPARIPAGVRLVVMASATDDVVGDQPARELVAGATGVPADRRRLVLVDDPTAGDHFAPVGDSAAARRTFWRPLDRLLAASR